MKPTITKGLGALTAETWGEIYQSVQTSKSLDRTGPESSRRSDFLARITGHSAITVGTAKWKYAWEEVRRDSITVATVSNVVPGRTGTTATNWAINTLEIDNTSVSAYGYAVSGGLLVNADGYALKMIPTGTIVIMYMRRAVNGAVSFEFSAPNPIDGVCPSGLVQELDGGEYGES